MFTYSIENYGVCGYNAIPSEGKKRQYDTHDFCSILRRYQGRTDFVLDQYLAAMFKLDQDVNTLRMIQKAKVTLFLFSCLVFHHSTEKKDG